jgi:hypothetical protein
MTHVGFTGTQRGMTEAQKERIADFLAPYDWLHHGDCVGADAEAHEIARGLGLKIVGHPPMIETKRAFCPCDYILPPQHYPVRNAVIADACDELLAAPGGMQEQLRSGTWATVRYARRHRRLVTIIYPDGSLEFAP